MKRRQDMDMILNKNKLIKPIIICCLCAKIDTQEEFISVFSTIGKINQLQKKIINYTPFKVDTDDNVQHCICDSCILKINQWHDFIQACIDAQHKINISSTMSADLIQIENYTTSTGVIDSSLISEKQCDMKCSLNKPNLVKNEFLSHKKTESEGLDPSETSLENRSTSVKNSNEDPCTKKCENNSLTNRRVRSTYCIARWCGKSTKTPGISLFRLPKDRERAHLWLTNAEREDLKILSSQILHTRYLCMEHFTDDMFMNSCKRKLVWNAIPTHFPKPKSAIKKVSQTNSLQNNVVFPAQLIFISKSHPSTKQRPIKPKPLNMDETQTTGLNKNINENRTPSDSEDSDMTSALPEIQISSRVKKNFTNKLSNIKIKNTSASSSAADTKKIETVVEDLNSAKTIKLKMCATVNNLTDLKQDKIQLVRRTHEIPSAPNTDAIKKDDNSVSSNDKKMTTENYSFMNEESYLNCDAENICLEHAYRETNERIYPCRYCGEMFLVKSNLILHQTTYHSDQPVGCDSCGRVLYKSRSEFMEHVCDRHIDNTHSDDHK